jgi:hypothetical protein
MSHIAEVNLLVQDLNALHRACHRLGLELVRGQRTYRWYGRSVGDYPLPVGFAKNELGTCEHAIRIPGNDRAYEIGIVTRRDGKPGYALLWDFYQGGYGLVEPVASQCTIIQTRRLDSPSSVTCGLYVLYHQKIVVNSEF